MLPRPSSKPRGEIVRLAEAAIATHGGPAVARVFYKYDCIGCDRRVTVTEPGVLPTRARCLGCGVWTTVTAAGYMLHRRASIDVPWDEAERLALYFSKVYTNLPTATCSVEFVR